jgi:hypothetical protein
MLTITLPPDLAQRLTLAARRLKRSPEDCALSAIRSFVTDCEDSAAQAAQLGQADGIVRAAEDFWD